MIKYSEKQSSSLEAPRLLFFVNLSVTGFFLMLESASLNFPKIIRETETDRREFPRALKYFGISSTADGRFNEKIV